ncbi:MAG TPA: hypothetical protein VMA83_04895 [Solirubrobacteraceae bacterium]|nr:hypothetical protein [Solirubrobacteraceae bacterium]
MGEERPRGVRAAVRDVRDLAAALSQGERAVLDAVDRFSHSRRYLAPLAVTVGGFEMLFAGLRLLISNWRLIVIQLLPAVVVWAAMYDLRARALHRTPKFHPGAEVLLPIAAVIVALTAAGFFLNAVFAFAISDEPPSVRAGFGTARKHARTVLAWGAAVGAALAVAVLKGIDWPRPWGTLFLGAVVAVLMICYVAVPARVVGVRKGYRQQEKWTVSLVGSAVGVMVEAPAYLLGRLGILLLGVKGLRVVGGVMIAVAVVLQVGATGAVRAVKFGSVLLASEPDEERRSTKLEG